MNDLRVLVLISAAAALPLSALTCAGSNEETSSTASGGAGGAEDAGAGEDAPSDGLITEQPDAVADAPIESGCVSTTAEAEPVQLDMLLLLDRSSSMTSNDKWTSAVTAILGFADSPDVAGMGLGLLYFPPTVGDGCNVASYETPAVPIELLPGNASAIKTSIEGTTPNGSNTPMRPALEGAITAVTTHLQQNPTHEGLVILTTDGDPSGCTNNTASAVATVAAAGAAAHPDVRTFVVGMTGANFTNLNTIAAAGGTGTAYDVGSGTDAAAGMVAALEDIRTSAVSCEYVLPLPDPSEGTLDLDSVQVTYTPGLNEPVVYINQVSDAGACGELSGGFYYDDPVAPTRIILCPASCDLVQTGTENARVDVVLGCIEPPPT